MRTQRGFTLVEVIIAIMVLTIGLLALLGTGALVTRMIGEAQRSDEAAMFAARRAELLRGTACGNQAAGSDTLRRGSIVTTNDWTITSATNSTWRILITTNYKGSKNATRTSKLETEVSCLF